MLACFGLVYLVIAGRILPKQEAWHGHGARTSTMTRPRRGLVFGGMSGTSLPSIQIDVDARAMVQAGKGAS